MERHPHFEAPPEPEEELVALDAGHFFAEDFGVTAAEQAAHEPLRDRLSRERADTGVGEGDDEVRATRTFVVDEPGHWNVIVTSRPDREDEARAVVAGLGDVVASPFANVVLVAADDVDSFGDQLAKLLADDPAAGRGLARVLPAQHTFRFASLADLEAITGALVEDWIDDLAGSTFHVRCHRRGRANDLDSAEEEDFLGDAILRLLAERGTPGRITFDDPDVVIDVETLNDEAAVSMWTRDDLRAYPFLRIG